MISVIVPVFNLEKYVIRTLDSIINQTYKDIEIIVVDDGSTDNTGEIVEVYAKKYFDIDYLIVLLEYKNNWLQKCWRDMDYKQP